MRGLVVLNNFWCIELRFTESESEIGLKHFIQYKINSRELVS